MIKKIESIGDGVYTINGTPYQKGEAAVVVNGELVSLVESSIDEIRYIDRVPFTDYRDGADAAFATLADLLTYLGNTIMI